MRALCSAAAGNNIRCLESTLSHARSLCVLCVHRAQGARAACSSSRAGNPAKSDIYMGNSLPSPPKLTKDEELAILGHDLRVHNLIQRWKDGEYKRIMLLCGAGISVSAGIPDFRSPGTGLYSNLQKYKLPRPESVFDIGYFQENPQPFYALAKEMWPGTFRPTPTHLFIRLLQDKGMLLRCYTQNIDTLERVAGIRRDLLVEAHGSFGEAECVKCQAPYEQVYVKDRVFRDEVPRCLACGGLVKPSIVFFGEGLPRRFFSLKGEDCEMADLVLIMGTSLTVYPFAGVKDEVTAKAPRLLINLEAVGLRDEPRGHGLRLDCSDNYRDLAILDSCDSAVAALAEGLGWMHELRALMDEHNLAPIEPPAKTMRALQRQWRAPPPILPDLLPVETGVGDEQGKDADIWRCGLVAGYTQDGGSVIVEAGDRFTVHLRIPKAQRGQAEEGRDWVALMGLGQSDNNDYDDYQFLTDQELLSFEAKDGSFIDGESKKAYELRYVSGDDEVVARFGPLHVVSTDGRDEEPCEVGTTCEAGGGVGVGVSGKSGGPVEEEVRDVEAACEALLALSLGSIEVSQDKSR